jgi:hypothetical protein
MPWVAIARGQRQGTPNLVRLDELAPGQAHTLIAEAMEWFQGKRRTWNVLEQRGLLRKTPTMIQLVVPQAEGFMREPADDLAGEQLLHKLALIEAHAHFGMNQDIIAVAAKRGDLVMMPLDPTNVKRALDLAGGVFGRASAAGNAVSPLPVIVRTSQVVGYIDFDGSLCFPRPVEDWQIPVTDIVLDLIRGRPEHAWHARDIGAMGAVHPIPALQELTTRGFLEQVDAWHWRLAGQRPTRILQTGATSHRIAVELAASSDWADTGLLPDVLGTRPLIAGMTMSLRWQAIVDPRAQVLPIILLRHVPDPACASSDRTFTCEGADELAAVTPSLAEVRLSPSVHLRFPKEPGRIEARIAGASGPSELFAVAGTIRLEIYTGVAGEGERPVRADHTTVVIGTDEFPELPSLPAVAEPIAWHSFG